MYIVKLTTKRKLVGTGFISPWIIGFLLFFLVPLVQTLVFSLNTVNITPEGYSLEAGRILQLSIRLPLRRRVPQNSAVIGDPTGHRCTLHPGV